MKALVGTRKGLLVLDKEAPGWRVKQISFEGVTASYAAYDPVNRCIWAGVHHGHWGPKVHVSFDGGVSFEERPTPKFPPGTDDSLKGFWGMAFDPTGRIYLGVEPAAIFHSDDQGKTWHFNEAVYRMEGREKWFGGGSDAPCLHSLLIHPQDHNKLVVGISVAGILRSDDRGATWRYSNSGQVAHYLPDPEADVGQDPHIVAAHPGEPDTLWQQNHCGVFRSLDFGANWQNFSEAQGLKGWFGWALTVADDAHHSIYTVPAKSDECRITVDGSLFVQVSRDGGETWHELRDGLPGAPCFDISYRHALDAKGDVVMFGTTNGNLYFSENAGEKWSLFSGNLPPIQSVRLIP